VIHGVVADIDDAASRIVLTIHWMSRVHTEHRLPKRRRGQRNATPDGIVEAVRALALIAKDDVIAGLLNRNGLKTGNGNRWTRERVTALRSSYRIPVHRQAEDGPEPWLNLTKAAALVGVAAKTLRQAAERGEVDAKHPLPDGPWVFMRTDPGAEAVQAFVARPRDGGKDHEGPNDQQQFLFPSKHSEMRVVTRRCRSRSSPTALRGPRNRSPRRAGRRPRTSPIARAVR
jgi:hypothetical protein